MPDGHVQTGRSDPDRSLPGYRIKIEYNVIFVIFYGYRLRVIL